MRFTGNDGKEVDEKIETYDDDTILYTLTDPEGHQSVIVEDYGRVSTLLAYFYSYIMYILLYQLIDKII